MRPEAKTITTAVEFLETIGAKPIEVCPKCADPRYVLTWLREPEVADAASLVSECTACGEVLRIQDVPGLARFEPKIVYEFTIPKVGAHVVLAEDIRGRA